MSTTTIIEKPRIVTLTNGKTVTIESNAAVKAKLVPTIDVGRIFSRDLEDRKAVAEEVREASRKIGFFQIVNHGLEDSLADDVLSVAKEFFAMPEERKMSVASALIPDEYCGYHPLRKDGKLESRKQDLYEAFNWNYEASADPDAVDPTLPATNLWPADLPVFKSALCRYQSSMVRFARQLTRIFALALDLPETAFDAYVAVPEAGARILHYPAQTVSRDEQNGIGAHTDVEYFTIIKQAGPGLEVLSKENQWVAVPPLEGSLVVNIADCFMRQTNDFFVSTVHRVINESGKERYSVPFFWGFDRRTVMEPISTCISEDRPNKYEVMTAGEYYTWRTRRQKARGLAAAELPAEPVSTA